MEERTSTRPPAPPQGGPQAPPAEGAGYTPSQAGQNYLGWPPQQPPPGQWDQWPSYAPPPKRKRRGLTIGGALLAGIVLAGIVALIVIGSVNSGKNDTAQTPAASAAPAPAPREPAAPAPAPPEPAAAPPASVPAVAPPTAPTPILVGPPLAAGINPTSATVARVVDGDTFKTTDGQTVRVLGIDSCEATTSAGHRATSSAATVLSGATVTLTSEPGVDRDPYNRALRYVTTSSGDFGRYMVVFDHTAVYGGKNDAALSYVGDLRALDPNGRTCDDAPPPVAPLVVNDDNDRNRVPDVAVPDSSTADGSSDSSSAGSAYYKNCSAARAAGVAPLHTGDPGYSSKLDRDNDGVACE